MIDCLTKVIIPRRAKGILRRNRLVDFLHRHIDCRVQVLSAGAGYGKTTLLVDFAQDVEVPVCWYSLDRFDADARVFLETLGGAIGQRFSDFGREFPARIAALADLSRETPAAVRLLSSEIYQTIPEYFIVALDDYHVVEGSPEVANVMEHLLQLLPDNCQLVISSRHRPFLPGLPRLLSQNRASLLTTDDLRFTPEEVKELYLLRHGVQLTDQQAQRLVAELEGWPTALHLISSGPPEDWLGRQKHAARNQLFEYLTFEVYLRQPERVRQFLADTSILTSLEPEICNYLLDTEDSAEILREIERANLFVLRVGEGGEAYQYHHLFQEFLLKRVMADKGRYTALHVRAGRAYEERGDLDRAIDHYQKVGEWDCCINILSGTGEDLVKAGKWESIARWVDAIPEERLRAVPQILVWRAQAAIRLGQMERALALASEALGECHMKLKSSVAGQAALVRAAALRLAGQPRAALQDLRLAVSALQGDPVHAVSSAEAHRQRGLILFQDGKFERAGEEWRKALALSLSAGDMAAITGAHDVLGMACAELGDFGSAFNHLEQAREGWRKLGNLTDLGRTLNHLGELHCLTGNYQDGLRFLREAVDTDRTSGNVQDEAWALWNIGDAQRDLGNLKEAIESYQQALPIARRGTQPQLVAYINASLGSLYGLQGKFEEAEQLVTQAISHAQESGNSYDLGLFLATRGNLYSLKGDAKRGLPHLFRSLALIKGSKNWRMEAWVLLALANGLFLRKRFAECQAQMKEIASIVEKVGQDGFLLGEASRMLGLIQYAASKRLGGGCFVQILARAQALHKTGLAEQRKASAARPESPPRVEAFALGRSDVFVGGRKVSDAEWRNRKSKELFFYLLSHRKERTKEQILDALWPEVTGAKGHSSLYSVAYRLRRALYEGSLRHQGDRYYLCPDGELWFDVEEFRTRLSAADRLAAGSPERATELEAATDLYRGPLLEEFYSEWCETLRRELEQQYIAALARLAGYWAAKGNYPKSVALLERIVELDPYREETYGELMRVNTKMGNTLAALQWYESYSRRAQQDLGLCPSPELTLLYNKMRVAILERG